MSARLMSFACFVAAATAGGAAFANYVTPFISGLLALLGVVLFGLGCRRGTRADGGLNDPSISTLVFPPESKFHASVLPPR
jgi:hypothetical protein